MSLQRRFDNIDDLIASCSPDKPCATWFGDLGKITWIMRGFDGQMMFIRAKLTVDQGGEHWDLLDCRLASQQELDLCLTVYKSIFELCDIEEIEHHKAMVTAVLSEDARIPSGVGGVVAGKVYPGILYRIGFEYDPLYGWICRSVTEIGAGCAHYSYVSP